MRQGDLGRAAQKVVAHTQGEPGGEHGILQGILQAPEGDSGSVRSGAKHRENASGLPGKPEEPRGQDGGQISAAHQIAVGVLVRQIVQELKIGYGMIQPWPIQRPIEEKPRKPARRPAFTASMESVSSFSTGKRSTWGPWGV